MPTPDVLAEYGQIIPDAPERILRMAEARTVDASARDDRIVNAEIDNSKTGTALAFLLTFAFLIASVVFFAVDNNIAGGVLLSFPVVSLIASFNGGPRLPRRDRDVRPSS